MTSKELVYKTLEFDKPQRIPRHLWLLPWAEIHCPQELAEVKRRFPDDIGGPTCVRKEEPRTTGDPYKRGIYIDEWNCKFENKQDGVIGEVKEPQVQTWADIEKVRPPRECLSVDIKAVNESCRQSDKFLLAFAPRPFERLQFLRGTENLMMDIALQEQGFKDLLKIVHNFYVEELEVWAKTDVDGLMFMDDWGTQRSLLISPSSWRQIFKPLYKDYIDIAHSNGKKVFMHSDGYILDVIEDMVELGLDALNSQIFCMGVETLGKRFKGRLTFWGEIDRQNLLPNGSTDDIEKAVKLIQRELYSNGGVIAQLEFGPGAKGRNVIKAFETWEKFTCK